MTTALIVGRDKNSTPTFGLDFTDLGTQVLLAASTEITTTVPAGVYYAKISSSVGTNVFVNKNATATLPTASFTATTQDLNVTVRNVVEGDVLHFISDTPAYVVVNYYSKI